ncbi:hypothetical protein FRB99_007051 [Tulasnella sp. 403]|nr:hypothetical protein FRB99_007051 [Tulasnella sp. 403]
MSPTPVYALSFLSKPPNEDVPHSRTILGWVGTGTENETIGFQENPAFREILHDAVQSALADPTFDKSIESEAIQRGEGWMNIRDNRNVPALNRVGDPDDIIGAVMVQDGKVVASTYQPMPTYRICTSDGPTRLTEGLATRLQEFLEKEWRQEKL